MDLDDIAIWVVEEICFKPATAFSPQPEKGNTVFLEARFECIDIVSSASDVSTFNWVDGMTRSETDV